MRWFVALLLVANVILFFWVQQQSRPTPGSVSLPPPEVGRLRLMSEIEDQAPTEDTPISLAAKAALPEPSVETDTREMVPQVGSGQQVKSRDAEVPASQTATATALTAQRSTDPAAENRPVKTSSQDALDSAISDLPDEAAKPASDARSAERASPERGVSKVVEKSSTDGQASSDTSPPERPAQNVAKAPLKAACVRVGPFKPDDADKLLSRLPPDLELVSDTSEEVAEVDGYYVLIPPLDSRAAGIQKVEELRGAGIKDIYLFRGGALRNAVSLGLYSNKSGAQTHADRLSERGVESVEVRERRTARERRWLQFRNAEGGDPEGIFPLPAGIRVIPQPCP